MTDNKLRLVFAGLAMAIFCQLSAQNMTDMAVMNDRSADGRITQSDSSTVNDSVFLHPDRVRFDGHCLQIDGHDQFILSGTFHYFRTPQPLWQDRLQKLKDAGFNCVETYVPWNWHEREMPTSPDDESKLDMRQLDAFLALADSLGLYTIVRPGPYICAEWSGGGFPQWLMRKKPAQPRYETWLQSTDPVFMQWNEHWYRAVCRVVDGHQIYHRKEGQGGVILFQIENEFNRIKWFPRESKRLYLEQLVRIARRYGIGVPIITCWTSEARNVGSGPLNGVVDMVNSYPRWQIERNFGRLINQQLKSQPGKPLISGELQGGWYSDVGGRLSCWQEGVDDVQTQNITLYALQRGFCALNFYMAVGGTNFDDWAARGITTTYDFAAAVSEDGTTTPRYDRLRRLAPFLMAHGSRIARARELYPAYTTTDTAVSLALRETAQGDRYYFIRTEDYSRSHSGIIRTDSLTLCFSLEPFGSQVYYLPKGGDGCWVMGDGWPKQSDAVSRVTASLSTITHHQTPITLHPTPIASFADPLPRRWHRIPSGSRLDDLGIYSRHPVYFRTQAWAGDTLTIGRIGRNVMNSTEADHILLAVDGTRLQPVWEDDARISYLIPGHKQRVQVIFLYESLGLHHHTNLAVEQHWQIGPEFVRQRGRDLPLEYALTEPDAGLRWSSGSRPSPNTHHPSPNTHHPSPLMSWHIYTFEARPDDPPLHIRPSVIGDGFIYVNGHAIGRCWAAGPQRDYYVPSCWLRPDGRNYVSISILNKQKTITEQ